MECRAQLLFLSRKYDKISLYEAHKRKSSHSWSEGNRKKPEVLVARKKRGRFANYDIFPGGKVEGTASQFEEAVRELREETLISVDPEMLRALGRLVVYDVRPGQERFGNIFLYGVAVGPEVEAVETAELEPRWCSVDDPTLTDAMPPDIRVWWPVMRQLEGNPFVAHVDYDEEGNLEVIVKRPDIAHMAGEVLRRTAFSAPDLEALAPSRVSGAGTE